MAGVEQYQALAESVPGFPLIIHNDPLRTAVNLEPPTLRSLWRIPEVAGVLESSGNLAQLGKLAWGLPKGKHFLVDDGVAAKGLALGARGLVSALASAYPECVAELVRLGLGGRQEAASGLQEQLRPLLEALAFESEPIPLKALLRRLGLCGDRVRLPLVPASPGTRVLLSAAVLRSQVA